MFLGQLMTYKARIELRVSGLYWIYCMLKVEKSKRSEDIFHFSIYSRTEGVAIVMYCAKCEELSLCSTSQNDFLEQLFHR